MDYWYRYRNDLWKRVRIYAGHDWQPPRYDEREDGPPDGRMACNIRRAQRMIEGYALCNPWTWFGTFTLNPKYHDRADLDGFRRDFMQFIRDQRKKYGDIEALLVPELHKAKDGWHMHGLLQGLPEEALRPFCLAEKLPKYIRDKLKAGETLWDWPCYRKAFGWVDIERIRSRDAAARYITKYITKAGDATAEALASGKHLYYITRGLQAPELIETENPAGVPPAGFPDWLAPSACYGWDYGEVQWYEPRKA